MGIICPQVKDIFGLALQSSVSGAWLERGGCRAGAERVTVTKGLQDRVASRSPCGRPSHTTLIVESGASVKEAQTLLRHSTPNLTMNVYARTRDDQLKKLAERVGVLIAGQGSAPKPPQTPTEGENAESACGGKDQGYDKKNMAERSGFEPEVRNYPYNGLASRRFKPLSHLSVWGKRCAVRARRAPRSCDYTR